ncbi:YihY/virulence factor BrkB family protein [Prosthecobacter sp.]|uniref:YihY/virulence factor BrkB family protein n=1 Tax=Prosthecobacter sp. TaxID=1965333 RepID=UPI003782D62C
MKAFIALLKQSFASWNAHNAPKMAAALAYYATFSMAPLLVLIVGIAGWVVEQDDARTAIIAQLSTLMGKEGGTIAEAILTQSAKQAAGIWATIIGFVVLLVGASGVFAELQQSLNAIWEVPPREFPWRALIRGRLLSFAMVFALGFLMLISLVLSAGIAAMSARMELWAPGFGMIWESANSLVSFLVITLLFAAIYRYLPDVRIAWYDVWTGAALTALLFVLGKYLLGIYIGHTAFASAYGAVGSLVIILAWIFYSSLIFFFGAEFTCAFARRHGSHCSRPALHSTSGQPSPSRDGASPDSPRTAFLDARTHAHVR